jgi:ABC-type multidrug transport system fused ATPase/permease subunit
MIARGVALDARAPDAPDSPPRLSMGARLSSLIGDRRGLVLALVVSSTISGVAEAAILAVLAELAAALVAGSSSVDVHIALVHAHPTVGTLIAVAFVLVAIRLVLQVPLSILPARIGSEVQARLRTKLFHSFTRASWDVQARDGEGQLQETMTGQVMQATSAVLNSMGLIAASINLIVLLIVAFALNVIAAAAVLVIVVVLFGALRPLRRIGVRRARELSRAQVRYARAIAESIRVAEETQVFGAAPAQRRRIGGFVATARGHLFATQVLLKLVSYLYQGFVYLLFVGALFGLYEIGRGHAASLGAVVLILVRAGSSGQNVQAAYQGLSQSMPFVERTQEAERRYSESAPIQGSTPLPRVATLAFEGVGYAYRPGEPVLSDIGFEVDGGEVIGVIGPSGAGKSTLVQLLLRLRLPGEGRYLVNGAPAEQFSQNDWHERVAYVPQEPRLLHASVAENIRYFRDLDEEAVERAARLARIHDDVVGWADGYETIVGPRADAVSGGQQQRICLARALAARPEVLVLDEPTSALDPTSEALIQESLIGLKQELTLFIVAHRMSTLDICDRVMIIIDGKLAAFETLELLREENSYFRTASTLAGGGTLPELGSPDISRAGGA